MIKSLFGKNPDLDDVDFIESIEAAFVIKFDNKELETWSTFGDVFEATCRHVRAVEGGPLPCLSASAYRHMRSAILEVAPGLGIRPDTALGDLIGDRRVSDWWRSLERESKLRLPALTIGFWSTLLLVVLILGIPVVAAVRDLGGWLALLSATLGVLAFISQPRYLPVQTVGDLARSVAALNAMELSQPHGTMRTRDVWASLEWIARDCTGYTGSIDRETVLIG